MNDEDYDSPYSSVGYKRSYLDEDINNGSSYKDSDSKPGSSILESYYDEDDYDLVEEDFDLDEVVDNSTLKTNLEKDDADNSWVDEYDPWIPSDDEEEEDFDTTMLGGDYHLGSEIKTNFSPKTTNQELLDWAKDRPGVNGNSSYGNTDSSYKDEDTQKTASQNMKKKVFEKLENAFSSRSKVLPPKTPNILDPLPPVTSLIDKRMFEPTVRVQMTRSKADILYDRLRNGDTTEPVTWYGQDILDRIGFEELCELIDIDVDPDSEAGEFLQELHDTYVSMINDIMLIVNALDNTKLIPYEQIVFHDPRSYPVVKKYQALTSSKSKEELENLAFEFIGDEDAEYVEKVAEAVFESLNKIFKKASGWGSDSEADF